MELTNIDELRALLARHGFRFSKAMGQNFLIAPWVPERIAAECGADEGAAVLEVGPGVGCLTRELAKRAGRVIAVELDRALIPVLGETLADMPCAEVVSGDALKMDLCKLMSERAPGLRPTVCANLPYNITSPLLTAFIDAGCFESITVMVQREVARRLCAAPGTADYGAFTLYVNWYYEGNILFDVSPDCFMPRPKVTSSVITFARRASPPAEVRDDKLMRRVVRAAFNQRRKTLVNGLANGLGLPRGQIASAIESCGFASDVRGETLSVSEFAALSDALGGER